MVRKISQVSQSEISQSEISQSQNIAYNVRMTDRQSVTVRVLF